MKNILIALAATVAFSALPVAHAQDTTPQVKVGSPVAVGKVPFDDYANSYLLSNGQKIKFIQNGQLYYVQVDNGKRVRIRAVSPQEFVTDAGAQIIFRDYGDEVGINNFASLPMAKALSPNTTMVARR